MNPEQILSSLALLLADLRNAITSKDGVIAHQDTVIREQAAQIEALQMAASTNEG